MIVQGVQFAMPGAKVKPRVTQIKADGSRRAKRAAAVRAQRVASDAGRQLSIG